MPLTHRSPRGTIAAAIIAGGALLLTPGMAHATTPDTAAAHQVAGASLALDEVENARTVIAVGKGAGISNEGIVIALMTARQESQFKNYEQAVDHDSLGIFQQRPAMGWGSPDQITDPETAAKSFYGVSDVTSNPGLTDIDGWEDMAPTEAAQAVQRSAYPDAYAQWQGWAEDFLDQNAGVAPIK
ncbi:peptidoglycan-binding protein [Saxibacter everestensis]|uniref:Peptidoglycan-binding protein n=1 Tax=Saxibacter everestensis TaxID=2909229 RepID=A0ABY8QXM4_9MICO|nr:peptidoglycan-binding protein [Brevibacteriaceae bacterium ZFBP1038]